MADITNPIKLRFFIERCEKENQNIQLVEKFFPSPKSQTVTGKFYAKHDALSSVNAPREYVDLLLKRAVLVPKDIYQFRPPTVNVEYGWFHEPLIPRSNDPRLYFGAKQSDFIKRELKLRELNKAALSFKK